MFLRDQKGFFRMLEGEEAHKGEMPEMEKFVKFWEGIWERERERERKEPHICHGWKKIRRKLNEKVSQVKKFNITFEKVKKEVAKRKGWTAPGIDRTISGKS